MKCAAEMNGRGAIGANAALPVAVAVPAAALALPLGSDLDAAFAKWERARDAWLNHPYGRADCDHPDYDRLEREEAVLCRTSEQLFDDMLATPSPDARGIARKLDAYLAEHEGSVLEKKRLAVIAADASRLGGN